MGKVRIKGEVRTSMLHERTSLSNLPSSKRKRQRSCFSVRVTDLVAAGVVEPAEAGVVPPNGNPDNVIGRIVSVLALPTANSQARMGSVLLRVQLYWPASVLDVQSAAGTVNVELWHHNYTIINHTDCTTHLLPADLIGPLVVVMPHPQRPVAKLGYCLVLQV